MLHRSLSRVRTDEIDSAAHVAVTSALALAEGDHLIVIMDAGSTRVGLALAHAARRAGAEVLVLDLDTLGSRPHKVLSPGVVAELAQSQASAFVADSRHAELGMRQHLLHSVKRFGIKHAHMPGISTLAFARGLRIDYGRVRVLGQRVLEKLASARTLEAHSAGGTRLAIELPPDCNWHPQLGVLEPGRWGNLPAGALYATPSSIEGTFVANASLGEYFGEREGLLADRPVRFSIERGRVSRVEAPHAVELAREVERMLAFSPESNRVGVIAVGVNVGLTTPTGEALVDQNLPGLHLAIGDPAARVTGATYSAPTSFAACQADATVLVDGAIAIHQGKLLTPA